MNPKLQALLDFLKAMGCKVRQFKAHAAVRFDIDSNHLEHLRQLVWRFCKEERLEWISENRASGDIFFE